MPAARLWPERRKGQLRVGESMILNENPAREIRMLGSMLVEGKRGQGGDLGNGTLAKAAGQPPILPPSTSAPLLDSRARPCASISRCF